ncbi:MAG: DUF1365 domain-containing protein [Paracoccaceae bacterium]|jgi:hypothetical protein|nr:DUF1365 domain-containing protein [Paracoccaceae bacterium]
MSGSIDHIQGHTFHGRQGRVKNAFRYSVDFVLLDAEKPGKTPMLFSRNAANLFSLHDRDHGGAPGDGAGGRWAREVFEQRGIVPVRIKLLAQPRILGHVFNPVSFWLACDAGDRLVAVIAEVSNTFGDRHSYFIARPDHAPIDPGDTLEARKIFHVSPFQPVEGRYRFRFDINADRIDVWIRYDSEKGALIATLGGERGKLGNRSILRSLIRRPFGSRRVLALIHWQALKLYLKGASYRARPAAPRTEVS